MNDKLKLTCRLLCALKESRTAQEDFETSCWKRSMAFIQEELMHLDNRLSDILNNKRKLMAPEKVSYFRHSFLKSDERARILQHELTEVALLPLKSCCRSMASITLADKMERLRSEIAELESGMSKLKQEFNRALTIHVMHQKLLRQ